MELETKRWTPTKCPRCGYGQILLNYDELACLQCGHDPEVINRPGTRMNGGNRDMVHNRRRNDASI